MIIWNDMRQTLVAAVRSRSFWPFQFFGNLTAFLLFVAFLHIGESRWYSIAFDFFVLLAAILLLLVLHAGTFEYFVGGPKTGEIRPRPGHVFLIALRHLPAVFLWAALYSLLFRLLSGLADYHYSLPGYAGSMMPASLRRIFGQTGLYTSYDVVVSAVQWIVLPGLLLPLGVLCAHGGFRGFLSFRAWLKMLRSASYWIVLVIASLIGVSFTDKLMDWKITGSVTAEEFWLGVRLFAAYLLAIGSWLWVCAMLGRRRQESTPA
jgi:hypothetical protein